MEIIMYDSYLVALAELGTAEQKRIKSFISKLDRDPTTLGLNMEPIDNGFVSIRANQRIRVIGQRVGDTLILHYIGDHDPAYEWARKRKLLSALVDGSGYRFAAGASVDALEHTETSPIPSHDNSAYGKSVFDILVRRTFPLYVARSLETCRSEEELYERLEALPQELQLETLAAILDLPYEAHRSEGTPERGRVNSLDNETGTEPIVAVPQPVSAIVSTTIPPQDAGGIEQELVALEKIISATPSTAVELPILVTDQTIVAEPKLETSEPAVTLPLPVETQLLKEAVSKPALVSTETDLRVERVKEGNWWLLQIYDGDTFIGSYEQSKTDAGAKEKEVEILFNDDKRSKEERDKLRKCAADELRKAYKENGEFIVRWNGNAIGKDGKKGVKQIKNKKTNELLGEIPRCCHRK